MKIIEIQSSHEEFEGQLALFFTNEGILIDRTTTSPLMTFSHLANQTEFSITTAYFIDQQLIVKCECSLEINNHLFHVAPIKLFMKQVDNVIQGTILQAIHWLTWDEKSQFCSQCGGRLHKVQDLAEKKCIACDTLYYPSLSPAVMILIERDKQLLLARSAHFTPGVYSAIAGFVDLGETAEAAAHREVKEELGIEIDHLEYFGTQSWPFPNSFMIAFKARYLSGELKIDYNEIEDAKWFDKHNLPKIPSYPSISNKLIESALRGFKPT